MDRYDGDGYIHGDDNGYGDGHSYGDIDGTRDFLSQPYSSAGGYPGFNQSAFTYSGSSNVTAPRMDMAALDLNSQGEDWRPRLSGPPSLRSSWWIHRREHWLPPVRARSASRTLGLRGPRSSGGGGATAGHATSSVSGGGRAAGLPPVPTGVRGARGAASGVPEGSRTRGKCPRVPTIAVAEDNFGLNNPNAGDNVEILPNNPTVCS